MSPWPSCLNHCLQIRRPWFDSPFCFLFFNFTHAQRGCWACARAFFDVIILTHMDFDIEVDNLGCDSEVFHRVRPRPWLPPWGPESWSAGAPWVSGFSPNGGSRSYSDGGTGECPLGKMERGLPEPPDGTCGQPDRRITRLTLGGFPAPRPREGRFSSGKLPGGLALPRTGDSSVGGSTRR